MKGDSHVYLVWSDSEYYHFPARIHSLNYRSPVCNRPNSWRNSRSHPDVSGLPSNLKLREKALRAMRFMILQMRMHSRSTGPLCLKLPLVPYYIVGANSEGSDAQAGLSLRCSPKCDKYLFIMRCLINPNPDPDFRSEIFSHGGRGGGPLAGRLSADALTKDCETNPQKCARNIKIDTLFISFSLQ